MSAALEARLVRPARYFDALAYAALAATVLSGAAAFAGPVAALAERLYPALALVAAALLLWRKPALYVGFMWWVWFLTPAVRRLVDYHTGYTEASLVMLAPFLVSGVALAAVLLNLRGLPRPLRTPLAFVAFALLYAYAVGVLHNGPVTATFDLLNWGVPVVVGSYLLACRRHASAFRRVTQTTFTWGLLVMGGYGVIQFFYLPPWDGYWMDNAAIVSIGFSRPQEVRVFSTLNSAGPFAMVAMAGLLLAFSGGGAARVPGAAVGFAAFALSAVRSAWGGWVVGLLVVASSLPLRGRARLLGSLLLLALVALPALSFGPVAELFAQRLQTVTDLQNDVSFNDRVALYADIAAFTAGNALGQGLGSTGEASGIQGGEARFRDLDSGVIAVVYVFGVLGTLYYVGGALALFGAALKTGLRSREVADAVYIGVTVAALSQLPLGNVWSGVSGMVLWFFPCLYLASRQDVASPSLAPPPLTPPPLAPPPLRPSGETPGERGHAVYDRA